MNWRPRRPVLITTDPIGGVWTYALELARELNRRGIDVALASMGRRLRAAERAEVSSLPAVELYESRYKLEWMLDSWDDVAAAGAWLRRLALRLDPCVIHLNQFAHGALSWRVPCLVVGHSCVYSWHQAVRGTSPGAEWAEYRRRVALGLGGADLVTAPSRWMLGRLKATYGGFAAAEPVYNGRTRRPREIIPKGEFVLTAGRLWDEGKNIAALEAVAPRLRWPVFAAGAVAGPDGCRARTPHLRLLGTLDAAALGQWMARAAIYALPARYEPFGLSVLEAALAGCALMLADIPSLRELWDGAALFAPPDDPAAIHEALSRLIADAGLRHRLAREAERRAAALTPERMAEGYLALYRRLRAPALQPGGGNAVDPMLGNQG